MTKLIETKSYMNPITGSVDTGENWMADQQDLNFPESDLDSLVEVIWDETEECWTEVK